MQFFKVKTFIFGHQLGGSEFCILCAGRRISINVARKPKEPCPIFFKPNHEKKLFSRKIAAIRLCPKQGH